jgi:hypothetical protein
MRWWPYETLTLESPLDAAEIQARLAGCSTESLWTSADKQAVFVGQVHRQGFRLVPLAWGQSSFPPQFHGRWLAGSNEVGGEQNRLSTLVRSIRG